MTKKIFIIAGEASGDILGSKLIAEIKLQLAAKNEEAEFIGVGGRLMQEQGLISIFPMEELSVMGFLEVVPHISKLLRRIKQTAQTVISENPDCVITIDSPDFCFRVVKKLQNYQGKKIHLIAPSVWAYREGRAEKISKLYDLLLAILPFEPPYFEKYGLKTVFIGNPIIETSPDFSLKDSKNLEFREKYKIALNDLILCVTPGSRNGEVKKIFPEFIEAINLLSQEKSNLKVAIPLADKTRDLVKQMAKSLKVESFFIEKEERESAFFSANYALAKSGTNTVELSLYKLPMIIAYKINFITHFLIKMMIKIKFANLVNLIANKEIIPEMLQKKCTGQKIYHQLKNLIEDESVAQKQISDSAVSLSIMGLGSAEKSSSKATKEILKII